MSCGDIEAHRHPEDNHVKRKKKIGVLIHSQGRSGAARSGSGREASPLDISEGAQLLTP